MKNARTYKDPPVRSDITCRSGKILMLSLMLITGSCVTEFLPVINEEKELLVVEGLVTDQPGADTIKLSKSLPFGKKSEAKPFGRCIVKISDDLGAVYDLVEKASGTYVTDSATFKGETGRTYTLHITAVNGSRYESIPMEMKPVPPIDSLYYEKTVIREPLDFNPGINGCLIYLDTHDPSDNCKYYRWDFTETWVLRLLFPVENMTCWITERSKAINIKSTAAFNEATINRYPINYITNVTDRLKRKYSILVNQYSLTEDEFIYWQNVQNLTNEAGGLYDIIPSSVPSNLLSIDNPAEKVLGFFSVSARSSKRIFIKGEFAGIIDRYSNCITDTIGYYPPEGLGVSVWVLEDHPYSRSPYWVLTDDRGCADCTVRGSNKRPGFWVDD
ncbi:MAG: DUF4249 domain-containing protein [Bacteroidota bacterium]|nr:DUF4249 domain-containing protein [Bacteroidota bacterium]